MANLKRAELAAKKVVSMRKNYGKEIAASIADTRQYDEKHLFPGLAYGYDTEISVTPEDSVSAVFSVCEKYPDEHTAVLNFASYKEAGGKFLDGSIAQEEALCHESILYPVLAAFTDSYYKKNQKELNRALYLNRALFSQKVLFKRDNDSVYASVLTCAAPNKTAALRYQGKFVSEADCDRVMKERIRYLLLVAKEEKVKHLILGAYGCGVFGHDADTVAGIFKQLLDGEFRGVFKTVRFAVMAGNSNLEAFQKVFS